MVQILELFAIERNYKMVDNIFINITGSFYRGVSYSKLAVIYHKQSEFYKACKNWQLATDELAKIMEPRQRFDLLLEVIETGYKIGEISPIKGLIEQAVIEFNKFTAKEWVCLVQRLVKLVIKVREVKWAFHLAAGLESEEYRLFFVKMIVESVGVTEIIHEVVNQYWSICD